MGKPPSKEMLAEAKKYYNLGVAKEMELSPFWGVSKQVRHCPLRTVRFRERCRLVLV